MFLSDRELDDARADAEATLPDTATRLVRTLVDDGQGGRTTSYVAGASFACRVEPNGRDPREDEIGGGRRSATRWVALVPYGTTIRAQDRLSCGGVTYNVLGVLVGGQAVEVLGRVDLELVEGD